MALFALIPQPGPNADRLESAVADNFEEAAVRKLGGGAGWLIVANSNPKLLSATLGIDDGRNGSGIVFQVATYFGRANPDIWAWINATWGKLDV